MTKLKEEIRDFDCLQTWIDYAEAETPNRRAIGCQSERKADQFNDFTTRDAAFKLFRFGHPKGLEQMKEVLEQLQSQISLPCEQLQFVSSVEGCAPNVEAYIQGLPDDMFDFEAVPMDAPPSVLIVQVELCYAARVQTSEMRLAGAVIFAATQALKMQGCAVELLASYTVRAGDRIWQATIPVPASIDLDTVAFLFTHPAALRTVCFGAMEQEPVDIRSEFGFSTHGGYSTPGRFKNEMAETCLNMVDVIHALQNKGMNMQAAKQVFQRLVDSKFKLVQ